jgi:hypothetical protein
VNPLQSINLAALAATLAAVVAGILKTFSDTQTINVSFIIGNSDSILLGVSIVLFRLKMALDDHKYFGDPERDENAYRAFGFVMAIFFWICFTIAGYLLNRPEEASKVLVAAYLLSFIWIGVHLLEIGSDEQRRISQRMIAVLRHKWIITNGIYGLMLILYDIGATVTVGVWEYHFDMSKWISFVVMLLTLVYDWVFSDSFRNFTKPQNV